MKISFGSTLQKTYGLWLMLALLALLSFGFVLKPETSAPTVTPTLSPTLTSEPNRLSLQKTVGKGFVRAVAWAPDGQSYALATSLSVDLYETSSNRLSATLDTGPDNRMVQYSPDGHLLAILTGSASLEIWDVAAKRRIYGLDGSFLSFSKDGKKLAVIDRGKLSLVDALTGKVTDTFSGFNGSVVSFAFNQAGNLLLVASADGVFLMDLAARELVGSSAALPDDAIRVVSFDKDDKTVFVVGDSAIHTWDPATNATETVYDMRDVHLYAAAINPAKDLVVLAVDQEIRIWRMSTHVAFATLPVESDWNTALALSPDATKLLTVTGQESLARLWDLSTSKPTSTIFDQYALRSDKVIFNSSGAFVFAFAASGTIKATDVEAGKDLYSIYNASQPFFVSPDGRLLAYKEDVEKSSKKGTLKVHDATTGKTLYALNLDPSEDAGLVAFSPDGKMLVYVNAHDHNLTLADAATGKSLASFGCSDVHAIAFSPDSRSVAYGGWSSSSCDLQSYDIQSAKMALDFRGVGDNRYIDLSFQQLVYSPDGGKILALDPDLMLFDTKSGEQLRNLKNVNKALFSPDGRYIAAVDTTHQDVADNDKVLILDANTGQTLFILQTAQNTIRDFAFSSDGQLLALAGTDEIELWDALTGQPLSRQAASAQALAFNQVGDDLMLFTKDATIEHWQIARGPKIIVASPTPLPVTSTARPTVVLIPQATENMPIAELKKSVAQPIQYSPDGKIVFFADDETVTWFDSSTFEPLGKFETTFLFTLSPNGKLLLFQGMSGASVVDVQTQKQIGSIFVPDYRASDFVFSKDSQYIAYNAQEEASGPTYSLHVWSVAAGKDIGDEQFFPVLFPDGHRTLSRPAISPDGKLVAAGHSDKRVYVWDLLTGKTRFMLEGHASVVTAVDFSPNGRLLASASDDGTIRFWNMATGKLDHALSGLFADDITDIHFSSDGKSLTVSVRNQSDRVLNLQTGAFSSPNTESPPSAFELRQYRAGYFPRGGSIFSKLLFSPDATLLAIADRHVQLFDSATQKPLKLLVNARGDAIRGITFSPDGKQVAVASASGYVTVWDVASEKSIFSQKSQFLDGATANRRIGGIDPGPARGDTEFNTLAEQGLSFSPDGRLLAYGNKNTIELWDVAGSKKISTLANADGLYATQVSFSADGKHLYAILNRNRAAQIWDVETGKLIRPVELPAVNPDAYTAIALNGPLFARNNSQPAQGAWVELWNLETGEMRKLLGVSSDKNEPLRFSPDGSLLTALGDRNTYYWKTSTGQSRRIENYALPSALTISADNQLLAKGVRDYLGQIYIFNIDSPVEWGGSASVPTATPQVFVMPSSTPAVQTSSSVISPANAAQASELSRFGQGTADQVFWAASGDSVIVAGSLGVDKYPFNPATFAVGEATHTEKARWSHSAALTSDGRLLSASVVDGRVLVSDTASGETLADLPGGAPVMLSADGNLLAYTTPDLSVNASLVADFGPYNMLAVWNLATQTSVFMQPGASQYLASPTFSPDGKRLAAIQTSVLSGRNDAIRVWDTATGAIVNSFAAPYYTNITSFAFSPDGHFMTGAAGGSAWVWDMRPGVPGSQFELYQGTPDFLWLAYSHVVVAAALSPDNSSLVVATNENSLQLYSRSSHKKLLDFAGNASPIRQLRFSPNGKTLLSVDADGLIAFWDAKTGKLLTSIDRHLGEVGGFVFRHDGALSVWGVGTDRVIAPKDAASLHTTRIAKGKILAVSPQGDLLTAYDPFQMSLWDAVTGDFKQTLEGETTTPDFGLHTSDFRMFTGAAFTRSGQQLFTAGAGGIWVYNTVDGKLERQFDLGILTKFSLSPDAKMCTISRYDYFSPYLDQDKYSPFIACDSFTGDQLFWGNDPDYASQSVFSPDGHLIGAVDSKLVLYTIQGQLVDRLVLGEKLKGVGLAFNPAGSLIAVGRTDGSILLIKLDGLKVLATILGHRGPVKHLAFSADGLYLASGGDDGTVRFWSVP